MQNESANETPSIYDIAWNYLRDDEGRTPNASPEVWRQMKAISRRIVSHELALAGRRDEARELLAKANQILR